MSLLTLVPTLAIAQSPTAPPPRHEASFEASYVGVTGNASTSTFGLGADVTNRPGPWLVRQTASFVRNESDDTLSAKATAYSGRVERTLNPHASAFGEYAFFHDRFAGVVPRNAVTVGFSLKAVDTDRQTLGIDVGAGYVNERRAADDDISSGSYVAGAAYKARISATAEVTDDLKVIGLVEKPDDWRVEHAVALTTKLASGLSLKVSNTVRFAHRPPVGFMRTDAIMAVALVAKFAR
jgi:putative salt-induced outer membrane protein YdiY